ncbi:hypothetical protein ACTJKC_19910 [Pedobacter sp. 22226]
MKNQKKTLKPQDDKEEADSGDGFPGKMVLFIILLSVILIILVLFRR